MNIHRQKALIKYLFIFIISIFKEFILVKLTISGVLYISTFREVILCIGNG